MTTSAVTSTSEKLEKLTRVSLFKNWDAQFYVKLVGQLQDSCQEIDSNEAARAILSAQSSALNLVLLDYLCALAVETSSILPMYKLIDYCRQAPAEQCDCELKSTIIVFLGQRVKNQSSFKKLLNVVKEYMKQDSSDKECRALASFLQKLPFTPAVDEIDQEFKKELTLFCTTKLDEELGSAVRNSFAMCLGSVVSEEMALMGEAANTGRVFFSRANRLLWLDQVMKCAGRIQQESFKIELNSLLARDTKQNISRDLILTSFDCFAVALLRKDQKYLSLWREFIIKRLPSIIKELASSEAPPLDTWVCEPLQFLDRGTLNLLRINGGGDALDEMFSSFPSTTSDLRHEFLQACVHFELINIESMRRALGQEAAAASLETQTKGKPGSDYLLDEKTGSEVLIEDALALISEENPEFVPYEDSSLKTLITMFEEVDGIRQAKIAQGLLQLVSDWLASNNSRCLRRFCQGLCSRVMALDALVLYVQPMQLLTPLIEYLDNWNYGNDEDEEDGETNYQELYTDFGAILLLVVMMYSRYDLDIANLPHGQESLVAYIVNPNLSPTLNADDLTAQQRDLIGEWVVALFDSGGIGDDLIKASSIRDLMAIVPIVFQQAIHARSKNIIDNDTLKGGLEYFLQGFLLATLIPTFKYLCFSLWENNTAPTVTLQVIQTLTVPSGMSGDAIPMHTAVMNTVSTRLEHTLNEVMNTSSGGGSSIELGQILNAITPYVINPSTASHQSDRVNGEMQSKSLLLTVKEQVVTLTNWAQFSELPSQQHAQPTQSPNPGGPPDYKSNAVNDAVNVLGAQAVFRVLVEELQAAEASGTLPAALDVVASLISVRDTIPKLQTNFRPSRRLRLDSSLLELVTNHESFSYPKHIVKALKTRVEQLIKQGDAVAITRDTNANSLPPPLPAPNVDMITQPSAPPIAAASPLNNNVESGQDNKQEPTGTEAAYGGDTTSGANDANDNAMDDPLLGLDVTMPGDDLFGDDMMMDLS